jgi:hypothetical protein
MVVLESIRVWGHTRNGSSVLRVCRRNLQKCAVDDFPSEAQEVASLALGAESLVEVMMIQNPRN